MGVDNHVGRRTVLKRTTAVAAGLGGVGVGASSASASGHTREHSGRFTVDIPRTNVAVPIAYYIRYGPCDAIVELDIADGVYTETTHFTCWERDTHVEFDVGPFYGELDIDIDFERNCVDFDARAWVYQFTGWKKGSEHLSDCPR